MSKTRDNHYVPIWYQRGFLEAPSQKLRYLDLNPERHPRPDGTTALGKSLFESAPSQCFRQRDLYSTFFGFHVEDEIERRLFGEIDRKGAAAMQAFIGHDVEAWIRHFEVFFEYIDAQKLRTPKGLDWLRRHYPFPSQNELMFEMQGVRLMHCSLWTEGVREIVSAEDSDVKFLISDHPVTVFNHATPPSDPRCAYPNDPLISWKGSQTIFPLNKDHCLILSNLEYAKEPDLSDPTSKRTAARNFRSSLVRADALIRTRRLSGFEVSQINYVLKARANRFIAAGKEDGLFPERYVSSDWQSLRVVLQPPKDGLGHFGGETYVRYKDGSVSYQDEFGRSEPSNPLVLKEVPKNPRPKDSCGCGSGRQFKPCCATRPPHLRPSWSERSIRERNLMHANAIFNILGLNEGKDWTQARREISDEKIRDIYRVFRSLWPLDTDLISLLPKPDGRLRALYTGLVDPRLVIEYVVGAGCYFGEVLVQNPFVHPGCVRTQYNPIDNPAMYRQEVLKSVTLLHDLLPLIDAGAVNLFPDPCHFDFHLHRQMMEMAGTRAKDPSYSIETDLRAEWLNKDDFQRAMWGRSEDAQRAMIREVEPERTDGEIELMIGHLRDLRKGDVLAVLQEESSDGRPDEGQFSIFHMAPNFEMSLFLAQATGSMIVTDSPHRWKELKAAAWSRRGRPPQALPPLKEAIETQTHLFPIDPEAVIEITRSSRHEGYRCLLRDVFRYLGATTDSATKPNWESQLTNRFAAAYASLQRAITKSGSPAVPAKVQCLMPSGGIRANTSNRLLLMSIVDHHLELVPMAFFIERPDPTTYPRPFY